MNNQPHQQCREHDTNANFATACSGTVRQYESGNVTISLCDYHFADLQDRMYSGSMQ
jgi:hypothetical protein